MRLEFVIVIMCVILYVTVSKNKKDLEYEWYNSLCPLHVLDIIITEFCDKGLFLDMYTVAESYAIHY